MAKDWNGNQNSIYKVLGASNHTDKEREEHDYYATEPRATELLCDLENFSQKIWEPACGGGHIAEVLKSRGYTVCCSDLIDRGYGQGGIDFLKTSVNDAFNGDIITNPPYKFAKEFVERAMSVVAEGHKVAMFLKVQFLEGKARKALFEKYPPKKNLCVKQPPVVRQKRRVRQNEREWRIRCCLCLVCMGKGVHRRYDCEVVLIEQIRKFHPIRNPLGIIGVWHCVAS